jgi:tetratricopeptide (TPR) repeat protein
MLLLISPLAGQALDVEVQDPETSKLRFAATQHEIISILLKEGQVDRILPEFEQILSLDLGDEKLVVQEAWLVVNGLLELGNFELSLSVIDIALPQIEEKENEFTLLMLKGKVFKQAGRLREAISVYRKAQQLQN